MVNIPVAPDEQELIAIRRWTIDIDSGRVFNSAMENQ